MTRPDGAADRPQVVQLVHLHRSAPPKPPVGQPCNGCGLCCAAEPCPIGVLVSGHRQGACRALVWSDSQACYRCGLVSAPRQTLPWLPGWAAPLLSRLARRWISAASGCDATLEAAPH